MPNTLSILMPVFNERTTVERAIDDALTAELPVESRQLVIVDDGSTDGTRELLREGEWPDNVTLVFHDQNRGKGAALQTGLKHATREYAAILDADLEYKAADLAPLLEPLLAGDTRVVFGTRSWSSHSAFSFWYVMGNKGVTLFANVLFNSYIGDLETCFKLMPLELYRSLNIKSKGFGMEAEVTGKLLRRKNRPYEVPISYTARTREEGKKITAMDGIEALLILMRERLRPLPKQG
jgi:dolichol-phosphate hexosyltransferase